MGRAGVRIEGLGPDDLKRHMVGFIVDFVSLDVLRNLAAKKVRIKGEPGLSGADALMSEILDQVNALLTRRMEKGQMDEITKEVKMRIGVVEVPPEEKKLEKAQEDFINAIKYVSGMNEALGTEVTSTDAVIKKMEAWITLLKQAKDQQKGGMFFIFGKVAKNLDEDLKKFEPLLEKVVPEEKELKRFSENFIQNMETVGKEAADRDIIENLKTAFDNEIRFEKIEGDKLRKEEISIISDPNRIRNVLFVQALLSTKLTKQHPLGDKVYIECCKIIAEDESFNSTLSTFFDKLKPFKADVGNVKPEIDEVVTILKKLSKDLEKAIKDNKVDAPFIDSVIKDLESQKAKLQANLDIVNKVTTEYKELSRLFTDIKDMVKMFQAMVIGKSIRAEGELGKQARNAKNELLRVEEGGKVVEMPSKAAEELKRAA